jgi:hypothetical protein
VGLGYQDGSLRFLRIARGRAFQTDLVPDHLVQSPALLFEINHLNARNILRF